MIKKVVELYKRLSPKKKKRKQPKTVAELKSTVEECAANLGEDAMRKMARHARRQALAVLLLRAVTSSIA